MFIPVIIFSEVIFYMKVHTGDASGERWNKTEVEETCDVVRGCEKRIYYVKNPDSEIFDEAYLILRRQERGRTASPREIELEAMRIVNGASAGHESIPVRNRYEKLKTFLAGAAASALIIGMVSVVIWLLM